ncbi:uncharacterized protein LOC125704560 isoform X1 [Brienomyrus brachyistius]|uniref:uncharacterized protein LOC125704560 isoform X1 n=1 Tax=Brienomyrus brachyistius TaxID=42636 RepID=UPI0020B39882|nr:uncharacterized protein LOC125704560 isoform X1 [Brienomyrus brachyistius]
MRVFASKADVLLAVQLKIMILLSLLTGVLLGALSAQAKVVQSFQECSSFFYEGQEPRGMDQNAMKICQRYMNGCYFATLYSVHHRIPVYSAYTFDRSTEDCNDGKRPSTWFIEPQISGYNNYEVMSSATQFNISVIKLNQAINDDYQDTGYDRGHLNPNCLQKGNGRIATFTLTNAAPMDRNFNRVHWRKWEVRLKCILSFYDKTFTPYIVTGTVPSPNNRIPKGVTNVSGRVSVPTHVWTAVCFVEKNREGEERQKFSFGFIGENKPGSVITVMSVIELNARLGDLYHSSVSIFADDCFTRNKKSQEIIEELKYKIKVKQIIQNPSVITECSKRTFDDPNEYFQVNEKMKKDNNEVCLLTKNGNQAISFVNDELRKRDVGQGSQPIECWVVPEKSSAEGMTTADGTRCQNGLRYCNTESGFKPCCTSPCLYQEKLRDFWCYSGQSYIQCSPQYSLITAGGEQCKDDHPCATYGFDYYWCETSLWSWDYCSPPLPDSIAQNGEKCLINHACGKYGYSYYWCYTDYNDHWEYCCTHNDRFSAINGKTCQPDHLCGMYGEDYLWCYTTDGRWDYCCVGD